MIITKSSANLHHLINEKIKRNKKEIKYNKKYCISHNKKKSPCDEQFILEFYEDYS